MAKAPLASAEPLEYPKEWENLDRDAVVAMLSKLGIDANTTFMVARWMDLNGYSNESYFFYLRSIGLPHAHTGIFGRFFERAYSDSQFMVAQLIAKEACRAFPKEARAWLWAARAAAAFADKDLFDGSLKKAEDLKIPSAEVALVREHTRHFFTK